MTGSKKKPDGKRNASSSRSRDDDTEWIADQTDKLGSMAWAFCAAVCKLIGVVFYALAVAFGGVDDTRDGSAGVPRKTTRSRKQQ